jgi:hypothetical protein
VEVGARAPAVELGLAVPPARALLDEPGLLVLPVPKLVLVPPARLEAAAVRLEPTRVQVVAAVAEPGLLAAQREQGAAAAEAWASVPVGAAARRC